MKQFALFVLLATSVLISSCSKDDETTTSEYPKIVNIKFEVSSTNNTEAIIDMTINNTTETEEVTSLPFNRSFTQQEVKEGTYLQLTYEDNSVLASGTPWENYTIQLTIYVDGEVISQTDRVIMQAMGPTDIEYTF